MAVFNIGCWQHIIIYDYQTCFDISRYDDMKGEEIHVVTSTTISGARGLGFEDAAIKMGVCILTMILYRITRIS